MAKYRIDLPDGRAIAVDADSPELAAEGGETWAKANPLTGRAGADADARKRIKSAPAPVRALAKGASFGFNDELDAVSAAGETGVSNLLGQLAGKKPRYGMKDAFAAVMAANNQGDAKFADAHPAANLGLQILGGVGTPGVAAGARFVQGARGLIGGMARSAAVGSAGGAIAGAGNSRGGLVDRGKGAAGGVAAGAVIGGAMPAVGRVAQTAGRAANAAIGQPFGGAARGAAGRLREALHQDGLDDGQIRATVQEWQRSGVTPEFLNVAGENTRALLRAAGSQGGQARNTAQAYRNTTVASIPNRAQERAAALTPGEVRTPAQFAQQMRGTREASANRNYGQWSDVQVTVPDEIKEMLADPAGLGLVRNAMDDAVALQDWPRQRELQQLLQPTRDGQLPRISAGTVERLRMAARDQAEVFSNQSRNSRAVGFGQRQQQLDGVLSDIPEAAPSRAEYAAQSRAIEAAEGGPSVMGPRSRFQPEVDALAGNPEAMSGAGIRERQRLVDEFGRRDQVKGVLDDIANAPDVRPNLQQLYGAEGDRFADAAGHLSQKQEHANFIAPNTGSQTQSRGQDAGRLMGAASQIMEMMHGSIRPLIERMARGLTMTERERQILVQMGVGTPDDALRALSAPQGPVGGLIGSAARRAGTATAPTVAGERQRQPAVEAWLEGDPSVNGASYAR